MTDYMLSEEAVRKTARAVRRELGSSQHAFPWSRKRTLQSHQRWLPFINVDATYSLNPYQLMTVDSVFLESDSVEQPSAAGREPILKCRRFKTLEDTTFVVNDAVQVPPNGMGFCTMDFPTWVLVESQGTLSLPSGIAWGLREAARDAPFPFRYYDVLFPEDRAEQLFVELIGGGVSQGYLVSDVTKAPIQNPTAMRIFANRLTLPRGYYRSKGTGATVTASSLAYTDVITAWADAGVDGRNTGEGGIYRTLLGGASELQRFNNDGWWLIIATMTVASNVASIVVSMRMLNTLSYNGLFTTADTNVGIDADGANIKHAATLAGVIRGRRGDTIKLQTKVSTGTPSITVADVEATFVQVGPLHA